MRNLLKTALLTFAIATALNASAAFKGDDFKSWASTPPMGWNSWDCYGPTVVESEVKANADYMAQHLKDYGWEYVVVDIRWFVENDKAGGYNQTNPKYVYDEWGRYTPALNRFPSAADGQGFKPLAEYVHDKGLKFGIHIMRGIPKEAVQKKLPVLGTDGITADMIANNDSTCTWLRDNMKVDWTKPGAQQYYNSIFDLYAQWGVDFIKIDDLSRPYHTAEVEMIRNAIDQCGRPIVLSISPGETPVEKVDHVKSHANMWRTVDDFWDNWNQLNYQFKICAKWAPHIAQGTWPDADMLPLGKISIRGERGAERWTQFTKDEQKTMMNLWTIFKSPLMFGGDLPQNDEFTNSLLTNRDVLYMHHHSMNNGELDNENNKITWGAIDPYNADRFAALFNVGGDEFITTKQALWRSGTISYLTTGYSTDVDVEIPAGSRQLVLVATDGGDGYDCDHADWINPLITLADGSEVDVTTLKILRNVAGWGTTHVNSNLEGGTLSIDGTKYDKGIATHANSILIFDLPEGAARFSAKAGIDNTGTDQGSKSSIEFFVYNFDPTIRVETTDQWSGGNKTIQVDPDKQIAASGYVSREAAARYEDLTADIKGAEKLYLVVTNGGDNLSYDHADWVNPILVKDNGDEVSLTTISWDNNPINGWNSPQINKNNDGNTLNIAGQEYSKGFGVNAPSVLTFTLPTNHDFVSFKVRCGLDNDVADAPSGATVEFRIFTENPAPDNDADVALDLALLGFDKDQEAEITELWTAEKLGKFKNDEFITHLPEHGSALFRVSPVNRSKNSSVSMTMSKMNDDESFDLTIKVDSPEYTDSYVQLLEDGKVIGAYPVNESGEVIYHSKAISGEHKYKACFSGTLIVKPSESDEVSVTGTSVSNVREENNELTVVPGTGSITLSSPIAQTINIYNLQGHLVKMINMPEGSLLVNLPAGLYILRGSTIMVR